MLYVTCYCKLFILNKKKKKSISKSGERKRLGIIYQLLKKVRMRDSKYFTPQQYKTYFKKVSKERNVESDETRRITIENIKDLREDDAAEELSSPTTKEA